MPDEQIIYLDPNDDLNTAREKIEEIRARRITMVVPQQTPLHSNVGWRSLHARVSELGKDVLVISANRQICSVAKTAGFRLYQSPEGSKVRLYQSLEGSSGDRTRIPPSQDSRNMVEIDTEKLILPEERSASFSPNVHKSAEIAHLPNDALKNPLLLQKDVKSPEQTQPIDKNSSDQRAIDHKLPLNKSMKVFYCYAREDKELRDELEKHLRTLKRQGKITSWHDRNISAGQDWEKEINSNLNAADIILLLISPDFMDSDYCYSIEMKRALERHHNNEARVIPIILRPVDWEDEQFSQLQVLPAEGKPVNSSRWFNRDEAFADIARGIRKVVIEMLEVRSL